MRYIAYIFIIGLLFSCSDAQENSDFQDNAPSLINGSKEAFNSYNERVSYAVGMDHGLTCAQVYNGPNTEGKFELSAVENGLTDYLSDADLKISIYSVDSILNLYLGENGTVNESFVSKSDASYALGLIEAQTLVGSMVGRGIDQTVDVDFLIKGIADGINKRETLLAIGDARNEVAKYYSDINKALGENFLIENAKNETVIETPSGLQYEVIQEGTGKTPNLTDSVKVHYTGRFIDGRVFESTIPSKIPSEFTPLGVIQGWQEGLLLMKEGGSSRFFIPYNLAYGEKGSGPIEPYSTLVFDIELLEVKRFNPTF